MHVPPHKMSNLVPHLCHRDPAGPIIEVEPALYDLNDVLNFLAFTLRHVHRISGDSSIICNRFLPPRQRRSTPCDEHEHVAQ